MKSVFRSLRASVRHATRGIFLAFRTERSFRIQIMVAAAIIILLLLLPLALWERCLLILAMAAVLVLELLNSAVERLVDLLKPRLSDYVADIKDLMAGAVLVAAFFSAILGLMILWPHVIPMFSRL